MIKFYLGCRQGHIFGPMKLSYMITGCFYWFERLAFLRYFPIYESITNLEREIFFCFTSTIYFPSITTCVHLKVEAFYLSRLIHH